MEEIIRLENEIVRLRPMELEDVDGIYAVACHPEIWIHMSITINTVEDVRKYVETSLQLKKPVQKCHLLLLVQRLTK